MQRRNEESLDILKERVMLVRPMFRIYRAREMYLYQRK
jgi:hypothetical protein